MKNIFSHRSFSAIIQPISVYQPYFSKWENVEEENITTYFLMVQLKRNFKMAVLVVILVYLLIQINVFYHFQSDVWNIGIFSIRRIKGKLILNINKYFNINQESRNILNIMRYRSLLERLGFKIVLSL